MAENLKLFSHVNRIVQKALEENREADKQAYIRHLKQKDEHARLARV